MFNLGMILDFGLPGRDEYKETAGIRATYASSVRRKDRCWQIYQS